MTTVVDPAFVAALAAMITAIGTLITSIRTSSTVQATQRTVADVHDKVHQATNGQHDEFVRDLQDLKRRSERMEEEMNTFYRAFTEQLARQQQSGRLRWRKDRR